MQIPLIDYKQYNNSPRFIIPMCIFVMHAKNVQHGPLQYNQASKPMHEMRKIQCGIPKILHKWIFSTNMTHST